MFVINFKLNMKKVLIVCAVIAIVIATIFEFGFNKTSSVNAKSDSFDYTLTEENFTQTLKTVHDNIDQNLGKTVKLTGFVFKMPDFKDGYFVCGRNTLVNNEDTVAGFLCNYKEAAKLVENEWIEITGVIMKGDYNGTMPVIKVGNITKVTAPANTFVTNINEQQTEVKDTSNNG